MSSAEVIPYEQLKPDSQQNNGSSTSQQGIKVYCRIRPSKRPSGRFSIEGNGVLNFLNVNSDDKSYALNSSKQKFYFHGLFDMASKQEDIFEIVAKDAVQSALDGFNATIFAYGQTGSGKTFTITGGGQRYADRGIIPRSLRHIFNCVNANPNKQWKISISYMEIYNEICYDLLDTSHNTRAMEDLPRVTLMEDEDGQIHLRNLSVHQVASEDDALNFLFLGDTNRSIAETPMNLASSRSHAIFTVAVESRDEGSTVVRKSKLHLVDLAGSERVSRTGTTGMLFKEAVHINKSLHFLELVIVALQEARKGLRVHIPYRNSLMTSILKDSLGGNCRTTMIATINPEEEHTDESFSSCRFAQRVARIVNTATVNESTDPVVLVQQLRQRVADLETRLHQKEGPSEDTAPGFPLSMQALDAPLSEQEKGAISSQIDAWFANPEKNAPSGTAFWSHFLGRDVSKITLSHLEHVFRRVHYNVLRAHKRYIELKAASDTNSPGAPNSGPSEDQAAEIQALQYKLTKSEEEIAALESMVSFLRKKVPGASNLVEVVSNSAPIARAEVAPTVPIVATISGEPKPSAGAQSSPQETAPVITNNPAISLNPNLSDLPDDGSASAQYMNPQVFTFPDSTPVNLDVPEAKENLLVMFKKHYHIVSREIAAENANLLREKYAEAKAGASLISSTRDLIRDLQLSLEKNKLSKALNMEAEAQEDEESRAREEIVENDLRMQLESHKRAYAQSFAKLRELKVEIESIQKLMEASRNRLQVEFEEWYFDYLNHLEARKKNNSNSCSASNNLTVVPGEPKETDTTFHSEASFASTSRTTHDALDVGVAQFSVSSFRPTTAETLAAVRAELQTPSSGMVVRGTASAGQDRDVVAAALSSIEENGKPLSSRDSLSAFGSRGGLDSILSSGSVSSTASSLQEAESGVEPANEFNISSLPPGFGPGMLAAFRGYSKGP